METFKTAIELAKFIKSLNLSDLKSEELMLKGLEHKRVNGTYSIEVPRYEVKLNGDMANYFNDNQVDPDDYDQFEEEWEGL